MVKHIPLKKITQGGGADMNAIMIVVIIFFVLIAIAGITGGGMAMYNRSKNKNKNTTITKGNNNETNNKQVGTEVITSTTDPAVIELFRGLKEIIKENTKETKKLRAWMERRDRDIKKLKSFHEEKK